MPQRKDSVFDISANQCGCRSRGWMTATCHTLLLILVLSASWLVPRLPRKTSTLFLDVLGWLGIKGRKRSYLGLHQTEPHLCCGIIYPVCNRIVQWDILELECPKSYYSKCHWKRKGDVLGLSLIAVCVAVHLCDSCLDFRSCLSNFSYYFWLALFSSKSFLI